MLFIFSLFETLEAEIAEGFVHWKKILWVRAIAFILHSCRKNFVTFASLAVIGTMSNGFGWF
jgi:hypothetical protein